MTLKAGERVKLVAVIRVVFEGDPEHYFAPDEIEGATPEAMAAIDQEALLVGDVAIEDLLYSGEVDTVYVYPEDEAE